MSNPTSVQSIDLDVSVSDRYQLFSTELTRVALLGIGALAYLLTKDPFRVGVGEPVKWIVRFACASFVSATGAALLHRHYGPDALGAQINAERRRVAGSPDYSDARAERDRLFKRCSRLLAISTVSLGIGVLLAGVAFAAAL